MKTAILSMLIIFLFAVSAQAETYCQNVNRTGSVVNVEPLGKTMNKWLLSRGVKYKTTPKEMKKTLINFCKSKPYGTDEDVTNHLQNIVNVLAAAGN
mgnify:CR=1 FL=1